MVNSFTTKVNFCKLNAMTFNLQIVFSCSNGSGYVCVCIYYHDYQIILEKLMHVKKVVL